MTFHALLVAAVLVTPQQPQQPPAVEPGAGIVNPVVLKKAEPIYPLTSLPAGIKGEVWLDAIVRVDGTLSNVKVNKSLDPALDAAAMEAAGKWLFKPGTKNGVPVPVHVQLVLEVKPDQQPTTVPAPISTDVFGRGAYPPGKGVVNPILVTRIEPRFSSDAMRTGLQGEVWVDAVILADGSVGDVQVAKSLDKSPDGLDERALAAARRWVFKPGTVNGVAVPVVVQLVLQYRR